MCDGKLGSLSALVGGARRCEIPGHSSAVTLDKFCHSQDGTRGLGSEGGQCVWPRGQGFTN